MSFDVAVVGQCFNVKEPDYPRVRDMLKRTRRWKKLVGAGGTVTFVSPNVVSAVLWPRRGGKLEVRMYLATYWDIADVSVRVPQDSTLLRLRYRDHFSKSLDGG